MLTFQKLSRKPTHFHRYTGLTINQFTTLASQLAPLVAEARRERLSRPDRKRVLGAGGQYSLSLEDRLLMSRCYHRLYRTQSLLGFLFNLDESNVCRNLQELNPSLLSALPQPQRLLQRVLETAKRIGTLEEFAKRFPDLKVLVDATEQPIRRPQEKKKRDAHYSGRRKRATKKRQITVTAAGLILDQTPAVPGRVHDFKLFKEHFGKSPPFVDLLRRTVIDADSGYQGMEDVLPEGSHVRLIQRARRNRPLTGNQRKLNSLRSSTRIRVEHTLGRVKKYQIAAEVYRGAEWTYDAHMNIVAGLVNLRLLDRQSIAL